MANLDQKTAIITGGGSGIGRASALRLAQEGAKVAIGDIRDKLAGETVEMVHQAGGNAIAMHCDVASEKQVRMMFAKTIDEFGGLDILVSNAGNISVGGIHELSLEDWQSVIQVHLTGTFLCAREALRHMLGHGGGSIITIGSVSSVVIGAGGSAASYKAAKGGILQFTRAIAVEYAHRSVRANCVCPGVISTGISDHAREDASAWTTETKDEIRQYKADIPMNRRADPMEVANVVAFLASDESSFMTGSAVMVDGGYTAI